MNTEFHLDAKMIRSCVGMYSENLGLNVVVGGNEASTDGNTTTIPGFTALSKAMLDTLMAYIVHESEHNLQTEFDSGYQQKPYWNLFEDHRIERDAQIKLPGTVSWFQSLDAHVYGAVDAEIISSKPDAELINHYLMYFGSVKTMNRILDTETLDLLSTEVVTRFGNELVGILDQALDFSKQTNNSSQAAELSDYLEELLTQFIPENQDQGSDQNQDQGSDQNQDQGSDQSQDQGSDQNQDQGSDQNQDHGSDQSQDQGSDQSQDQGSNQNQDANLVTSIKDKAHVFEELLNEMASESECEKSLQQVAGNGFSSEDSKIIREVNSIAALDRIENANIRKAITSVMQCENKRTKRPTKRGRIKPSKLHRTAVLDPYVFERKKRVRNGEFDITVLLDTSSSMRNCMHSVISSTCALLEGIERAKNCSLAFNTFPSCGADHSRGEKLDEARLLKIYAEGGTPIMSVFADAIYELRPSKKKKVIIVITDLEVDRRTADSLNKYMEDNHGINYIWVGLNTKFDYKINGHAIDGITPSTFAEALLSLKNQIVA